MTNWAFDPENNSGTLTVEGDMTINHIGELKDRLVEALDRAELVRIDVSAATAIDVAGLQLLCACRRSSAERGKRICLQLGANAQFAQFLDETGFAQDFICHHDDASEDHCNSQK